MLSSRRALASTEFASSGPLSDGEECNNELTQLAAETVLIINTSFLGRRSRT